MKKIHSLELTPIGIIHSPYKNRAEAPYQGYESEEISQIEVFREFEKGLKDIEGYSHNIGIYWFRNSQGYRMLVRTSRDESLHGLFTTRSPHRPCPLGLIVAELVAREKNVLKVNGLDAIDGTPLLDVKPAIPSIDEMVIVKPGWFEGKLRKGRS